MHCKRSFATIDPGAAPEAQNVPTVCDHPPRKGRNRKTSTWSPSLPWSPGRVCSAKSTLPSSAMSDSRMWTLFSDAHFIEHEHSWKVLGKLTSCLNCAAEYNTIIKMSTASYLDALFLELLLAFHTEPWTKCCRSQNQLSDFWGSHRGCGDLEGAKIHFHEEKCRLLWTLSLAASSHKSTLFCTWREWIANLFSTMSVLETIHAKQKIMRMVL